MDVQVGKETKNSDIDVKPGIYRHFKGGKYRVLDVAIDTESQEPLVVYRSLEDDVIWARSARMFVEQVQIDERAVPRFVRIETKFQFDLEGGMNRRPAGVAARFPGLLSRIGHLRFRRARRDFA